MRLFNQASQALCL